jgi:cell division transport system permease protein
MNRRVNKPSPAQLSRATHHSAKQGATKQNSAKKAANKKSVNKSQSAWFSSSVSFSSLVSALPFTAWADHHRFSCVDSLQRLLATPWQSMMTWLVVAIALVLPALLYLAVDNIQPVSEQWQNDTQLSLYIEPKAQPIAIEKLQQRLSELVEVDAVELITPAMAQQEFQQYSGLGSVLASLDSNPLPYVLTVQATASNHTPEQLSALQVRLQKESLVESVQLDMNWLRRLQEIMHLAQRVVLSLALLLSVGVILIIGNTIRLAIESRRNEIVVIKMVGGTDGFIKRPFLYTGFWYGIGGAILALPLLFFAELWLSSPVQQLAFLYESEYTLSLIDINIGALIIMVAGVLGWLGAWLSVSRHLKNIEPE